MAFSNTPAEKLMLPGGILMERGRWNGAGVTTGTITASTSTINGVKASISEIYGSEFTSDGDTAVIPAGDVGPNARKLTFTSGDVGTYMIYGRAT